MSTPKMIFCGKFSEFDHPEKYITRSNIMLVDMGNEAAANPQIHVLGTRLYKLRKALGLSQVELSQLVMSMAGNKQKGSQSHISNMEKSKGEKLPSVEVLRALAIALETNTDYLLGLTDDDRPHGQLDDQVVVTVEDPDERRIIQEATEALVRATKEDKDYIVGLIRRLSPKPPRIIGDE